VRDLKLVKPNIAYKSQYVDFINECKADIEKWGMSYYIPISNNDSFPEDIQRLRNNEKGLELPDGWVPASTYWLMDENCNRIFGIVTIRHSLVGYLLFRGGHISYYIRINERRKGYATSMLSLALKKCRDLHIDKVMITCAKNNIGSAKTIKNNGGILHSEDIEGIEEFQRYWIDLSK
jgi:predicted acetyltransferase